MRWRLGYAAVGPVRITGWVVEAVAQEQVVIATTLLRDRLDELMS